MNRYILHLFILTTITGCSLGSGSPEALLTNSPDIYTDSGMVVSAHPQSSLIGIKVLKNGGNAIDAAVATGFALSVCYPEAGNLGGGGFILIRTSDGKADVIDSREKAPLAASRSMFQDNEGNVTDGLSTSTHLSSGVPGSVDGLISAHSKYGRLPLRDVIQPAIDLAQKGFFLTKGQADDLNSNRLKFIERNLVPPDFVKSSPWKEGDTIVQKNLAETLTRIRDFGRDGFYSGKTARLIIKEMKRGNGMVTEKDLNEYHSVSRDPVSADYKGYRVITVPPPSGGGLILIQLLGMIEPYPLKEWGLNSSRAVHLIAEAEKRAFADRSEYMGDPDFMKIPSERLIDKKYLHNRMSTFNEKKATPSVNVKQGAPELYESEETTHFSVVDADGNAVAVTTTLNDTFGNSIVADSAGFLLNNEMDDFSVKPGFPNMYGLVGGEINSVQPGKRMLSSMTPAIVEKEGKLFLVLGSPGGSTIPTSVFQVIVNVIDFSMSITNAVDAGRFHHQWFPDVISYEKKAIDSTVLNSLTDLGYKMKIRSSLGRVNAIMVLRNGKKAGGADKRGDNSACGY
jgi:gamma-glutamyltranspeptidase / glutathione hydrolase